MQHIQFFGSVYILRCNIIFKERVKSLHFFVISNINVLMKLLPYCCTGRVLYPFCKRN